jgi:uncharacterized damage-inducible protein DinB
MFFSGGTQMNKLIVFCLALILAVASSAPRSNAQATATASFNVRQAAVEELKEAQKEIVSLAQVMPQEKYTWRPAEGVRSVSEVYLHVSAGNFGLGALAGIPAKPGFKFQGYEKSTTDKTQVIAQLNESFEYAENGISALSDADLQKAVNWRDYPTVGDVILHMVAHAHEHLGQSIAYARTNGVVPPWTAEQQQRLSQAPRPPQK